MGRFGRVFELLVVAQTPADDIVLIGLRQRFEMVEVVDPLLGRDKAGAVEPGPQVPGDRGFDGGIVLGVLCAVLVARQIEPAIVFEPVNQTVAPKRGFQRIGDGPPSYNFV